MCAYFREVEHRKPEHTDDVVGTILYEEIGDVKSSFSYTQNVLYGCHTAPTASMQTSVPVLSESHDEVVQTHDYELVKTIEYQGIGNAYAIQQCSAYGVAPES